MHCYAIIACITKKETFDMANAVLSSVSDLVRQHVRDTYLRPARRRGEKTFAVNVGTVHKELALSNRVPLVCLALKSKKFLEENALKLISKTGPPSGQSTTVTFTYEILNSDAKDSIPTEPLLELRGIAKDVFRALGGGEAFIREERKSFSSSK
jgi:hypothetical protein